MGNSSDSEAKMLQLQSRYKLQGPKEHPFFGQHHLLTNTNNPKDVLIKKQIFLNSAQELSLFLKEYNSIQRKPFSLLYPILLINSSSQEHCSTVREIYLYFQIVGRPLYHIIKNQGPLSEVKAWFLLNEIMEDSGRPHWAISPETIYQNKTKNYLIYDSLFVFGPDPTNFLNTMRDNKVPFSEKTQHLLERGVSLSRIEGYQQDMYALGLTLLFAITGIHAKTLPAFPQRQKVINQLLVSKCYQFSSELTQIIKCLTDRQCSRRIDNNQLRRRLREREADIIKRETLQFQLTYRNSSHKSEKQPLYHTKRETGNKKQYFGSPGPIERQSQFCPKIYSGKQQKLMHQTPKHNKTSTFLNIQDLSQFRSQNRQSTWQTKRSDIFQSNRRGGRDQQRNLTRIQSFDQLIYKS